MTPPAPVTSLAQLCAAWCALLACGPTAGAADADNALLQAAVIVTTFDRLDAGCAAGYTVEQREQVRRWQADNDVDALRARLPELRADAAVARLDRSVQQIVQIARRKGASDCTAAASLVKLPDARIGKVEPARHAAPTPPPAPATAAAPVPDAVAATTLEQIDSFAFATRPKMGMGGFIALDIHPVVLFKSGELLTEVRGLRFTGGLAAHRAAHPHAWTRWRREGGQLQMLKAGQWTGLPFNKTYPRLPPDLRLAGTFRSVGGTGNVAIGGTQAVTVVDEYRFSADGRVVRRGAVGGTAQAGDTSVVTRGGPGERAGRYRVEGLLLRIAFDDGSGEQRVLITDPDQPGGALWLDGESYVQRR
jgi:hypothetical protein